MRRKILSKFQDFHLSTILLRKLRKHLFGKKFTKDHGIHNLSEGFNIMVSSMMITREKLICLGELPEFSAFIVEGIMEQKLLPVEPGQLAINGYRPGEGLIPHIDKSQDYGDEVIGISLGSDIIMDLVGPKGEKIPILLPRRSLYILQGEARYVWKYGIPGRKTDKLKDGKILIQNTRAFLTYRIDITKDGQIHIPPKQTQKNENLES